MILNINNIKDVNGILESIAKIEKLCFPDSFYSLKTIKEMSENKDYIILIDSIEVKGYIIIHNAYDIFEVMKIGVDKSYRCMGIGKQLIEYQMKSTNKSLQLEVRTDNNIAIIFYEKLGFIAIGNRKNYYLDGQDALVMVLKNVNHKF